MGHNSGTTVTLTLFKNVFAVTINLPIYKTTQLGYINGNNTNLSMFKILQVLNVSMVTADLPMFKKTSLECIHGFVLTNTGIITYRKNRTAQICLTNLFSITR